MKKKVFSSILTIFLFLVIVLSFTKVEALQELNPDFNIIIKASDESHLKDGFISYVDMGINSGPLLWGTTKFVMSVDGGKTWVYAYCLNNDLYTPYGILNTSIKDFSRTYNYDNISKILYYGFGGDGWNGTDYEYVRKHSYYIWMPHYDEYNEVDYWHENWTEDMAYVFTHLALSYSYYYDVLGLSETEAEEKAFFGVLESEEFNLTKAKSVAKMWYEYLIEKPIVGINLYSEQYDSITPMNSPTSDPLSINFHEMISIDGNSISSDIGGRIEFSVPKGMNCVVTGEHEGATKPGTYSEGTNIVLGSDQNFNLYLAKPVDEIEHLHMNLFENYNIAKVDGGTDENGNPYQNMAGIYKVEDMPQVLGVKLEGKTAKLNITKKTIANDKEYKTSNSYYFGVFLEDGSLYDVLKMTMNNEAEKTTTFYFPYYDETLTYTIKETDENGVPLNNKELKITMDKEKIIFDNDNLEININVTNEYSIVESPDTGNGRIILTILILIFVSFIICVLNSRKIKNVFLK